MLKKLAASIRQYKKESLLAPVYVTLESILEIIIPTLMAYLIDYGINQKNMSYVLWMGLVLIIFALLSLLTGFSCRPQRGDCLFGLCKKFTP